MSRALALALALLPALVLAGVEPFEVKQSVAPLQVKLGEPFVRTVVISHPGDQRWELRTSGAPGPLELLGYDRQRKDGPRVATTTFQIRLSAFQLGQTELPPLTFDVATADGEVSWSSEASAVEVVPILPPDAEEQGAGFYDIRPPEAVPVPSYTLLWALAGALAAALLGWLLYRWWKRPRPASQGPLVPVLPLEVRTRSALDQLAKEELPRQGKVKEFYVQLTGIVRGYLGERYGVEALECTSTELLDQLKGASGPPLSHDALAEFLYGADLVKFARAGASLQQCQQALQFGYQLLESTTSDVPQRQLP